MDSLLQQTKLLVSFIVRWIRILLLPSRRIGGAAYGVQSNKEENQALLGPNPNPAIDYASSWPNDLGVRIFCL